MTYRVINCFVLATIASGVLGCSTHPLPQDVSTSSTVHIVRKVRCEAKEGMEAALKRATARDDSIRRHVERIIDVSTIGFEFTFVMSESNGVVLNELTFERTAATADGFKLIVVGDIGPDAGAPENWSRKNTRTFRVIDKLKDLHKAHCGRAEGNRPNLIYPITGSTGMAEVVRTYIELEALTNLAPQNQKEIVTFSDKLDFTTTFAAGAGVDLEFSTAVGVLRLTKASLTGSVSRRDFHSVTVSLASDQDPDLVTPAQRTARMMLVPMTASSPAFQIEQIRDKDVREGMARRGAFARNRVLLELERRRLVDEDRAVAERVLGTTVP